MVVSDLHLGYEATFKAECISSDLRSPISSVLDELRKLIELYRTDKLILLGDIKSSVKHITRQEWQDVPEFFRFISEYASVYLIPGNHDSNIGLLVPQSVTVGSVKGIVLANTLLTHGHVMPPANRGSVKRIVIGHIHPTFSRENSILNSHRIWLFLKARKEAIFEGAEGLVDIVILPCFNRAICPMARKRSYQISPIIKRVFENKSIQRALAVTLDGSIIAEGCNALTMIMSQNASHQTGIFLTD